MTPSGSSSRCGTTRASTSRTKDGSAFYILEYANGLRAIGLDNCYTWADHSIQWRVEGTEGIAKGTIGWPDYPAGSPSTITWTTRAMDGRWERPTLGGACGSRRRSRARWAS